MPVFELGGTRQGRWRAFLRAQFPLLVGAVFVSAEGWWALPSTALSASSVFGLAMIVAVSVAFVVLPWERWPVVALLPLAVFDIVGVGFMRLAYFDKLPSVGILIVFPVVWLAYSFHRCVITVAVAGALFVTLLPALVNHGAPSTPLEVASVLTLPVLISGLSIAVGEAARQLSLSQHAIHETNLRLQASLRKAEDSDHLSRTIFNSVEVALAFYDTDRRLVMANSLAEQAAQAAGFRLDHEPYAGPHVLRADNKTPIPHQEQIIPRALRGELESHEMEWVGLPGHQAATIATAQQVLHSDGEIWGTLIAAHDVTDLARSLQVKEEFIATVSHELRTPLTTIIGYLEILNDDLHDQPPFIQNALATITRSALKLQHRVKELLDTADRRRSLELQPTDLAAIARRMATTFSEDSRTAQIILRIEAEEPCWITADPAKIEQVVENLVSNAIKYTPIDGTVTIAVTDDEQDAYLQVEDTGIGMTDDEIDLAFTTFWRADTARDQAVPGIGIGLSLVHDITTAHRGDISLTSEPGTGTRATLRLPRHN